jgi:hypothetical protein
MGELGGTAVRVRHVKNVLSVIEALPLFTRETVLAAIPASDLQEIRQASGLAWIDVRVLLGVNAAVAAHPDPALLERVFRAVALVDFGSAYLRPFIAGAVSLFGPSPGGFVKWVPRTWGTVLRNAGNVEARDVSAHEARLVHTNLARVLTQSTSWLPGHRAYFDGIFDVAKTPGAVLVEQWEPDLGKLVLRFAW